MKKRKRFVAKKTPAIQCASPIRKGLDIEALRFIKDVDAAFNLMRKDIVVPELDLDIEDFAVKQYLVYLSMLLDVVLSGLVMNAVHGNDTLVLILQRLMVEYAAKALYYQKHPDFAVFMVLINEADSAATRARDGGASPEDVEKMKEHAAEMREKYSSYANIAGVTVRKMIEDEARTEDWAWIYGSPSVLIHGEPEGMRGMFEFGQDSQTGKIALDDDYLNAHLVDAAYNSLIFCRSFIAAFHPANQSMIVRFDKLEDRARLLIRKLNVGRDSQATAS